MAQSVSIANTGAHPQLISRDYKKIFFDEFSKQPEEYRDVANVSSMDGAYIKEGQLIGFGAMQQMGEAQPTPYDSFTQGNEKEIRPDDFGLAFAVTENMLDDDQTGLIKKAFQELARSAALTRELKFWDLLNSGFVTTRRTGIDGAALFASHSLVGGGSYSNYAATAGALNITSLQAGLNNFEKMVSERGDPRPAKAEVLICSPDTRFEAEVLLKSEYNPENANQQVNTVGNKGLSFKVVHYISSAPWFLLTRKQYHDLRFINRKPLQLKSWSEPSKRIVVYQGVMRLQTHFSNWYGVYGNSGA